MNENSIKPRTAALLEAVQDSKPWIKRFTRREYAKAFQDYTDRFGPACREALGDPEALPDLAEDFLDGIAGGWKQQRVWNRTMALLCDKQMLVTYFSPLLLKLEGGERLSDLIRDGWAARWPKDAYQTGTFEELRDGFRNTVMGLEIFRRG